MYLAKVQFALQKSIYRSRYPFVSSGLETAVERYIRRPAEFIVDFGWPDIGQLNADVWQWIIRGERSKSKSGRGANPKHRFHDPNDVVRSILLERLRQLEPTAATAVEADAHLMDHALDGDWAAMLDYLTEGELGLIDSLFTELDQGRTPTRAHIFLTFLTQLMGIPLVFSLNFDTLLEQAMQNEGLMPKIFDIHRDAELPNVRLVRRQLSLVKLHGSAYGLRIGERLQYSLDQNSRQKICGYSPDESLLVVIGFSGWERRMVQVIGEFAKRRSARSGSIQVLWLTTSHGPEKSPHVSSLITELDDLGLKRSFVRTQISDANSFLPGLFYRLASSFPAARQRYDAFVSRPMLKTSAFKLTEETLASLSVAGLPEPVMAKLKPLMDKEFESRESLMQALAKEGLRAKELKQFRTHHAKTSKDPFGEIKSPSVLVLCDKLPRELLRKKEAGSPSSWASLAAVEFTSSQHHRDVIWIDLENHHTVEAVVRDILTQIRKVDPKAPQLMLPTEPSSEAGQADYDKPAESIREALQRGRYVLVFDSLESFSRPHIVHHGLPRWNIGSDVITDLFEPRVIRLCDFLCTLIGIKPTLDEAMNPGLLDTIVILTLTSPVARHPESVDDENPFVEAIKNNLRILLLDRITKETIEIASRRQPRELNYYLLTRVDLPYNSCTRKSDAHCHEMTKLSLRIEAFRNSGLANSWIDMFAEAARQRNRLRSSPEPTNPNPDGGLGLLAILSFFRRPRPLSVIRSLISRWIFDPGDLHKRRLLAGVFESIDRTLHGLAESDMIDLSEGENVWIPRQIHEALYDALTRDARVRRLPSAFKSKQKLVPAMLAMLMASTWHLHAARVFFSDVYLPSHDEQAFFEFIYHQISALRYLAVAQTALEHGPEQIVAQSIKMIEERLPEPLGDVAEQRFVHTTHASDPDQGDNADNAEQLQTVLQYHCPRIAAGLNALGLLSFVRRNLDLTNSLKSIDNDDIESNATVARRTLCLLVYHIRRSGITTLLSAFDREQERISATTTPDTWLGWITPLLDFELPELAGRWQYFKDVGRFPNRFSLRDLCYSEDTREPTFEQLHTQLRAKLAMLKLRLLRGKLAYDNCTQAAAEEIAKCLPRKSQAELDRLVKSILDWCEAGNNDEVPLAWMATIADLETPEKWSMGSVFLLKCWCELARGAAGQGKKQAVARILALVGQTLKHALGDARALLPGGIDHQLRRLSFNILKAEAEFMFNSFPMWQSFEKAGRPGSWQNENCFASVESGRTLGSG